MINETKMLSLLKKKERVFYERYEGKHLVATPHVLFALHELSPRLTAKLTELGMNLTADGPQEAFNGLGKPGPAINQVFVRPDIKVNHYHTTKLGYHVNGSMAMFLVSPSAETTLVQSAFLAPFCVSNNSWQTDLRFRLLRTETKYSPVWVNDGIEDIALIMPVVQFNESWAEVIKSHVEAEGNSYGVD